jgi:hypothetical protein
MGAALDDEFDDDDELDDPLLQAVVPNSKTDAIPVDNAIF